MRTLLASASVRRELKAMAPETSEPVDAQCTDGQHGRGLAAAVGALDMDATVKPLYGCQEGA